MTVSAGIKIPALSCPLGSGRNTNWQRLNAAGIDWTSRYRLFSESAWHRYVAMRPGHMSGCVMPDAPMGPGLPAASNLLFWRRARDPTTAPRPRH